MAVFFNMALFSIASAICRQRFIYNTLFSATWHTRFSDPKVWDRVLRCIYFNAYPSPSILVAHRVGLSRQISLPIGAIRDFNTEV
ncbi:hypothetical protein I3760_05G046500 [Carya illinoinensis]|nr:hypothetical protein I3760_05G046500 [Carya illinoinensis]